MKKSFLILFSAAILCGFTVLSSCISSQSFIPVKGNGIAVEKTFDVSGFNGIEVSGGFDVVLSQGSTEQVVLTAQENLYKYIHVEVVQGVLRIYTEGNIMPTKSLNARILLKDIDHLDVSGGGDVTAETELNFKELETEISGGGDLTFNININNFNCRLNGGGDARLNGTADTYDVKLSGGGDFRSQVEASKIFCNLSGGGDLALKCGKESSEINIDLAGGGDAEADVNALKVKASLSGGGNATFSGMAADLDVVLNGGGDLNATNLRANSISFQANGGSDIYINASKEITGNISGGGDVYYSGSPETVSIDAKGGSEVHKQ
jgi:hypothetical protein